MTARARGGGIVGDVQRFGLFSAAAVVDRYTAIAEKLIGTDPLAPVVPDSAIDDGLLVDTAARLADGYLRALTVLADAAREADPASGPVEQVVLPPGHAGQGTSATLWLHNPSPLPLEDLSIAVGGFVSPGGGALPAGSVSLAGIPASVAANDRAEVTLRLRIPADQRPGSYHGVAVVGPGQHAPLVLSLDVLPAVQRAEP